jgi:Tfp pilus assembly protein PilF
VTSLSTLKSLAVILLLAVLAGCTTAGHTPVVSDRQPEYDSGVKPTAPTVPPPVTAPVAQPPQRNSTTACAELLDRAGDARSRGEYQQALALLERAQRIEPGSARVYLDLARTHQSRGDSRQARATAERGLLYCSSSSECDELRAFTR